MPQDGLADCSRILANYYLQKYDKFASEMCQNICALYFRYADDQMILLNDSSKVEKLLLLLTRNLDHYGLRVNQMKVKLWKKEDLLAYRCMSIQAIFSDEDDRKNPLKVLEFAYAYLSKSTDFIFL